MSKSKAEKVKQAKSNPDRLRTVIVLNRDKEVKSVKMHGNRKVFYNLGIHQSRRPRVIKTGIKEFVGSLVY